MTTPKWQDAPSGGDNKLTFQYAVNSSTREELELFLQEIIQNPKDAGIQYSEGHETPCPHVNFRIDVLEGDEKNNFLDHFKWIEQKPHIEAVNQKENGFKYKTYDDLVKQGSLCLLYVEDYNTVGLIGPEDSEERSSDTKCFAGVFSRGTSEKAGPSSGGTNGYGKAVMHIFSGVKTFVAFSKLSKPYQSKRYITRDGIFKACETDIVDQALALTPEDPEYLNIEHNTLINYRLMGETAYPQHSRPTKLSSKIGFVHYSMPRPIDSDVPLPFINDEAKKLAGEIGFRDREASGTSFLIVDFLDKDKNKHIETQKDAKDILNRIEQACLKLYWPAIVDQKITVSTQWGNEEAKMVTLDGFNWQLHKNIYEDYKQKKIKNTSESVPKESDIENFSWIEKKQIQVPKRTEHLHRVFDRAPYNNPPNQELTAEAVAVMGYTKDKEKAQLVTFRGSRQIIEFIDLKNEPRSNDFYPYGIVLLGDAVYQGELGENIAQSFLEQLIATSEPIAHDKLDPNSENMRNVSWPSAPARIKDINTWIKRLGTIQDDDNKNGSSAVPDLAQLFSFLNAPGSSAKKSILKLTNKSISIDQNGICTFFFHITVPGFNNNKYKFIEWSVEPKVSLASKTKNVSLKAELKNVTKKGDSENILTDEKKLKYVDKRPNNNVTFCFYGQVEDIVDITAKIELHIVTQINKS